MPVPVILLWQLAKRSFLFHLNIVIYTYTHWEETEPAAKLLVYRIFRISILFDPNARIILAMKNDMCPPETVRFCLYFELRILRYSPPIILGVLLNSTAEWTG